MSKFQHILIIEDDTFISELYQRALRKSGYNVSVALGGVEGQTMALTGDYDLILLDIMVPEINGIEILKKLRSPSVTNLANCKIIITTNLDQDESARAEVEALADGYLIKADVTPKKLVEIIGQMESS